MVRLGLDDLTDDGGPAASIILVRGPTSTASRTRCSATPEYYLGVLKNLATVVLTPLGLLPDLRAIAALAVTAWLAVSTLLATPLKFHVADYYYLNLLPPAALLIGLEL